MNDELTQALVEKGHSLGFRQIGVINAQPARRLRAYHQWLENDYHGQMGYMARPDRIERRRDLNVILPGARSIISVTMDYKPPEPPSHLVQDPSRGRISNYAWGVDYHMLMEDRLEELSAWLQNEVRGDSAAKVYVDTGAILERDHGESARLGFTGKNTMLIHPRGGSTFFLGEILTSALLMTTAKLVPTAGRMAKMPRCGTCSRCLAACPTGAFPAPYVLDARRCISYLTIELKGWIPQELRPMMGNWIYGCDICQDVCPFNRFSPETAEKAFFPIDQESTSPQLLEILFLDEPSFQKRYANSPIRRIGRVRLVRNACVAAGNWGSGEAIPVLARLLHDPAPLIRGHAAWALGMTVGKEAIRALSAASGTEHDERVLMEIAASH
ncbi:MAG TPA: tRNA epoxyqueuosine(34) reductase QueG [candidate division Zixibacteria bacterium]|nr:tRNA epoxyqueuosine(34) reductase QueG [candidate division Zixibacteria bacterium]